MKTIEAVKKMNELGSLSEPFIFILDYEMKNCIIERPSNAYSAGILFDFNGFSNASTPPNNKLPHTFYASPIDFEQYKKAFDTVKYNLYKGNSYLVNLTFETPIETNLTLEDIFQRTKAKYKVYLKNKFVVFSPEPFLRITQNTVHTYPMKGTIDARLPHARQKLLKNIKEQAEHATIVDLLRNDLSQHAHHVTVEKFRYIEKITTPEKELLQMSSHISGKLNDGYKKKLGNIIFDMLPAGSVSGAPKAKTCEIIAQAENYKRGFYTGIAGYFDGANLDSCVLIRFIEQKKNGQMVYKSGGGITSLSKPVDEYNELKQKIYVPID